MKQHILTVAAALLTTCAFAQQPAQGASEPSGATAGNQPEPLVLLVPVEIQHPALQSGCWAQLHDERNFKGNMVTIVGPMELQSLDKSTGRQLRRSIDSVTLGPKATLTVFEHRLFKDRSVTFQPNAKEGSVLRKLGGTGRIESLRLTCAQ